jgi:hypothetical protein
VTGLKPVTALTPNVRFGICRPARCLPFHDMPQWIVFLAVAIVAWFVFSVGGGLVVGRLIRRAESLRAAGFPAPTGRGSSGRRRQT